MSFGKPTLASLGPSSVIHFYGMIIQSAYFEGFSSSASIVRFGEEHVAFCMGFLIPEET